MGVPFAGAKGRLLCYTLAQTTVNFTFHTTYLVACRPTKYSTWTKQDENRPPSEIEIKNCFPRIQELIDDFKYDAVFNCYSQNIETPKYESTYLFNMEALLKKEYKLTTILRAAKLIDTTLTPRKV
jgi:hypothetical protein